MTLLNSLREASGALCRNLAFPYAATAQCLKEEYANSRKEGSDFARAAIKTLRAVGQVSFLLNYPTISTILASE